MTKKDFVLLAKALAGNRPMDSRGMLPDDQWESDCRAIADALENTNPGFDYRKFLTACGIAQ